MGVFGQPFQSMLETFVESCGSNAGGLLAFDVNLLRLSFWDPGGASAAEPYVCGTLRGTLCGTVCCGAAPPAAKQFALLHDIIVLPGF